jgi:tRNA (guanine37-N1)-methyltransferase
MIYHIITLFPESLDSYINSSIISRAISDKKIKIKFYNPRKYTQDKNGRVDQKPYGGGPGMVLEAMSVIKAIEASLKSKKNSPSEKALIWLSPSEKQFDTPLAEKMSKKYKELIIVCGRYEGIDERVVKITKDMKIKVEKISVGPYVLTGGELPALILLDTISRRIPGVLGNINSLEDKRISAKEVYTRPEILEYKGKKYRVPKVLVSGHQKKIEEWKMKHR